MKKNVVLLAIVLAMLMPAVSYSEEKKEDDAKLNTIGVSVGPTWDSTVPLFFTVHGTYTPIKYSFIELGMDIGFLTNGYMDFALYPFTNYALYLPFPRTKKGKRIGGWYVGTGVSVWCAYWTFDDVGSVWDTNITMNFVTGFNILNFLDISSTLRTDFNNINFKVSVGYVYRFK